MIQYSALSKFKCFAIYISQVEDRMNFKYTTEIRSFTYILMSMATIFLLCKYRYIHIS